jgi:hypothetical protein
MDLEAEIDRLLFEVVEAGGMSDVEDALRLARRRLILSHARCGSAAHQPDDDRAQ